ncbi:hypothetical protein [Microbacterium binotii]|uniref:hypothetical protein n=1 Tax=Microbacterium binotii TaxID=462710 RepID=UPI001F2D6302|nr:hypothetical protein [Microbacterium binotii]UIN30636.1 hypothetical protein LXM64_00065 [Microbacterium binotii]
MAAFDRARGSFDTSLALLRFRVDQADLSHFYWVGAAESELFSFTIKSFPLSDDPMIALVAPAKYERRLGHAVEELKRRVKVESRWRRLLVVLLMTSALERYMLAIATAAVSSDPALSPGFPKRVDGALLSKHQLQLERPNLDGLVKGSWSSRIATYKRLFGDVPPALRAATGKLEKLRLVRNRIAHDFGFGSSGLEPHVNVALGARRTASLSAHQSNVGEKTIVDWLQTIGAVSIAVDRHLMENFVGGFETVEIFLSWRRDPDRFEAAADINMASVKKTSELNRFGTALGTLFDRPVGNAYLQSLRTFVDAL